MAEVKYSLRTVTEEVDPQNKEEREEFEYPDGSNAAWVVGGVNGWSLFRIATRTGRVPKELDGLYTTYPKAVEKIKGYIAKLEVPKSEETGTDKRGLFKGSSDGDKRVNVSA